MAETPTADQEQKSKAYEAVLKSRTFARSEQLQNFLRHICELELAGRGQEITEYSIATEALHRRASYAPGEDSSVRSRAHALRHKLQEYYQSEAPDADWRLELPKGSYRPQFVKASLPPAELAPAAPATALDEPVTAKRSQVRPFLLGFAFAAELALLAWAGLSRRERAPLIDPLLRQAWGPALTPPSDVLIVAGCPPVGRLISVAPGLAPKVNQSVKTPAETEKWYGAQNLENRGGPLYMFPSRGYTVFSDALAMSTIGALLTQAGVTYQAVPEPTAQPMSVHERALVLIGAPAYAPFVARMLKMTPFSVHYDPVLNDEVISEGPPGHGRKVFIPKRNSFSNRFSTVYGLITVLPSQPGRERPERTIIFSGITGSPGAQAAVQYFSSPVALRDLQERFRREGYAQFPTAYQVVVRCGVDAEVAINAVYEAHRIMSQPPIVE